LNNEHITPAEDEPTTIEAMREKWLVEKQWADYYHKRAEELGKQVEELKFRMGLVKP